MSGVIPSRPHMLSLLDAFHAQATFLRLPYTPRIQTKQEG